MTEYLRVPKTENDLSTCEYLEYIIMKLKNIENSDVPWGRKAEITKYLRVPASTWVSKAGYY